jgi:hypothetical protein
MQTEMALNLLSGFCLFCTAAGWLSLSKPKARNFDKLSYRLGGIEAESLLLWPKTWLALGHSKPHHNSKLRAMVKKNGVFFVEKLKIMQILVNGHEKSLYFWPSILLIIGI